MAGNTIEKDAWETVSSLMTGAVCEAAKPQPQTDSNESVVDEAKDSFVALTCKQPNTEAPLTSNYAARLCSPNGTTLPKGACKPQSYPEAWYFWSGAKGPDADFWSGMYPFEEKKYIKKHMLTWDYTSALPKIQYSPDCAWLHEHSRFVKDCINEFSDIIRDDMAYHFFGLPKNHLQDEINNLLFNPDHPFPWEALEQLSARVPLRTLIERIYEGVVFERYKNKYYEDYCPFENSSAFLTLITTRPNDLLKLFDIFPKDIVSRMIDERLLTDTTVSALIEYRNVFLEMLKQSPVVDGDFDLANIIDILELFYYVDAHSSPNFAKWLEFRKKLSAGIRLTMEQVEKLRNCYTNNPELLHRFQHLLENSFSKKKDPLPWISWSISKLANVVATSPVQDVENHISILEMSQKLSLNWDIPGDISTNRRVLQKIYDNRTLFGRTQPFDSELSLWSSSGLRNILENQPEVIISILSYENDPKTIDRILRSIENQHPSPQLGAIAAAHPKKEQLNLYYFADYLDKIGFPLTFTVLMATVLMPADGSPSLSDALFYYNHRTGRDLLEFNLEELDTYKTLFTAIRNSPYSFDMLSQIRFDHFLQSSDPMELMARLGELASTLNEMSPYLLAKFYWALGTFISGRHTISTLFSPWIGTNRNGELKILVTKDNIEQIKAVFAFLSALGSKGIKFNLEEELLRIFPDYSPQGGLFPALTWFAGKLDIKGGLASEVCHSSSLEAAKNDVLVLQSNAEDMQEKQLAYIAVAVGYASENIGRLQYDEDDIWNSFKDKYASRLTVHFSNAELTSFEHMKNALKEKYNIEFIERFRSMDILLDVLDNRLDPQPKGKKIVTLIYPKSDWNTSFQQYPTVDRLTKLGFDVRYYEAGDEDETKASLDHSTTNGANPSDAVVLAGHGSFFTLQQSALHNLYITDFWLRDDLELAKFVKKGGTLILHSCSNGWGGTSNPFNMANSVADKLPGIIIQSESDSSSLRNIKLGENGLPVYEWGVDNYTPTQNL